MQQQQDSHKNEHLLRRVPCDVWAEIALQMLDARDLMALVDVLGVAAKTPPGAKFVAKRILTEQELGWFAMQGIPVALLVERVEYKLPCCCVWKLNGNTHNDNDLPAIVYCNGDKCWQQHGELHRDGDLPAIVRKKYDEQIWYQHGKRHREGGLPAVVRANGDREWWWGGRLHRDGDLPAIEIADGSCMWYQHGQQHRDGDLPAVVHANGDLEWRQFDRLHRNNDLPAVVRAYGDREWWVGGSRMKIYRESESDSDEDE